MTRAEILDTAKQIVTTDRENQYGAPEDSFATISGMWEIYLKRKCVGAGADVCITPEDVAVMMSLLKIARIITGDYRADNFIDLAGYAACAGEIAGKGKIQ